MTAFASSFSKYPRTLLAWVGVSALIILVLTLLPRELAFDGVAVLLTVIATIYVGFALQDGRTEVLVTEVVVATVFVGFALAGLWLSPYLWAVGLFLHGVWDWQHHPGGIQTTLPTWYPPVCVVLDWLLAGFLLVWL